MVEHMGGPDVMAALLDAFGESPDVLAICERDGTIVGVSREFAGLARAALVGRRLAELATATSNASITAALTALGSSGSARLDAAFPSAKPTTEVDGGSAWYQLALAPLVGAPDRITVIAADITARKETEDRLKRAEALMTDTQGTAHLGTWEWDPTQPHATWSAELYRIYGLTPETYTPSYEAYLTKVHPDDRAHVMAATNQVFTTHEPYSHDERILRPDGSIRYLHTWAHAVVDPQGKLERLIGVCQDITDRKLVDRELAERNALLIHEAEERVRIEKLLRRAQKLEAIGRLTGGIAHDFNNVLGVVIGYASIVHRHLPVGSQDREYVSEIMTAVERAGRMTSQLLAFSSDHVIARGPLDLGRVVGELAQLIRRLIGEGVELEFQLADTKPIIVNANGSQLEQVLMNLALNARDAMADGGKLTIATARTTIGEGADVPPGDYAVLSVTDTGSGMSEDVQLHIFDPFYTTKELGKGTGLGLSTVYGIVKQSGGSISVVSEPGKGARFDIMLPLAKMPEPATVDVEPSPAARGSETILLVEDEPALRMVIRHALESFGYHVLEAGDAFAALELAASPATKIDLVLTDVVMPKLSGRELVELLLARRPGLRVLYMSGYTADIVLRQGVIEGSVAVLRKPFTADELGRRLRELLD